RITPPDRAVFATLPSVRWCRMAHLGHSHKVVRRKCAIRHHLTLGKECEMVPYGAFGTQPQSSSPHEPFHVEMLARDRSRSRVMNLATHRPRGPNARSPKGADRTISRQLECHFKR